MARLEKRNHLTQRRKDAEHLHLKTRKPPTPLSRLFPSLALCVKKAFRAVKFLCPSVFSRDAPVDSRSFAGKKPFSEFLSGNIREIRSDSWGKSHLR